MSLPHLLNIFIPRIFFFVCISLLGRFPEVTYALLVTTESDCIRISSLGFKREQTRRTFVNTQKKRPPSRQNMPEIGGTASNESCLNAEDKDS